MKPPAAGHQGALAMAIAGLILLALANSFPLAALLVQGQLIPTTLPSAVQTLWADGQNLLAMLVAFTTIVAPAAELIAFVYVLGHLHRRHTGRFMAGALRFLRGVEEWNMTEVFMLGALVALVKLGDYAEVHFGIALWSLGGTMFVMAVLGMRFEPHQAWEAAGRRP
jgi:paraquat-inducible protein A